MLSHTWPSAPKTAAAAVRVRTLNKNCSSMSHVLGWSSGHSPFRFKSFSHCHLDRSKDGQTESVARRWQQRAAWFLLSLADAPCTPCPAPGDPEYHQGLHWRTRGPCQRDVCPCGLQADVWEPRCRQIPTMWPEGNPPPFNSPGSYLTRKN